MRTPVDLPVLALIVWLMVSGVMAERRAEALFATAYFTAAVYLFFQIPYRWLNADSDLTGVVARWAFMMVPVATAIALLNFLWNPHLGIGAFRRFTLPGNVPAFLAWGLEVALLLGLGLLDRHPRVGVTIIGVGVFGLIETFSRWALLGFGAGVVTWSLITARRHPKQVRLALLALAVTVLVVVPLPLTRAILIQYARPRTETGRPWQALARGFSLHPGLTERIVIWQTALRIIHDHPWFGVGSGEFGRAYLLYRDPSIKNLEVLEEPSYLGTPHAHNELLTIIGIGGIPAGLAYVWVLATAIREGLRRRDPMSISTVSALVAVTVHGLFDGLTTVFIGPMVALWTLLALAVQPAAGLPGTVASKKNAVTTG